jgi:cell division septal protein FtsQ
MPVSAPPADKRFRRSQVRPTSRRDSWRGRSLRLVAIGGALVLLMVVAYGVLAYLLGSSTFTIRRITVSGNQRLSTGQVQALLGDLIGTSMLAADIKAARNKLHDYPWVQDVEIRRVFPNSVAVALTEQQAVALGQINETLFLIDRTANIIDEYGPNYAEFDLPIVNGLTGGASRNMLVDEQRAAVLGRLLASLQTRPDLFERVSEIDLRDPMNVVVVLKGDTAAVRLGREKFAERLSSYVELASTLRERVGDIDYVDVRYVPELVVGPRRR